MSQTNIKSFWFAVDRQTHHFTPDSHFWEKKNGVYFWQFLPLSTIFSYVSSKKKQVFLPTDPTWKFWVSKQQTNIF